MISIQLLGNPVLLSGQEPVHIPRRKSRAVLYYVAAQDEPVRRETLLSEFWIDTPRSAAQQVLRTTLHGLRKALGEAIEISDQTIGLGMGVEVDATRFRAGLHTPPTDLSKLSDLLELYRGQFLEGFDLPDTPAFEDWLASEREHYRRLWVRGLTTLSRLYEEAGETRLALETIDRILAQDPLQEDLQREAIRLAYVGGDRPAAIRRYDGLRRLLDEEMGVPPMAETRTLYDSILNDQLQAGRAGAAQERKSRAVRQPEPDALPFTGRTGELRAIREIVESRRMALIEGEAGIGKTRLAEEFLRGFEALPLTGAARELERNLPYQPVVEALRSLLAHPDWPALYAKAKGGLLPVWLAETARLLPELAQGASAGNQPAVGSADEARVWEGVSQFLQALARQRPLALFIDDLQWADASTLGILGYLVRHAAGSPVYFLAASRPPQPRASSTILTQALTREGRLGRLLLQRLAPEEVVQIAQRYSRAFAYPLAEWLNRNSEGNPYVLSELVRYAQETGIVKAGGAGKTGEQPVNLTALSETPTVPHTVYELIRSRLAALSEGARRLLDVAVAAGREFDFEQVARVTALSETAALDALDELVASRLVRPVEGLCYRFDHQLTMEVAYQEVGEARHRLMHRRLAEALESQHTRGQAPAPGVIAFHFLEGGAPERAAPYAWQAGQQAAAVAAWREAINFYEAALGAEPDVSLRREILLALGDAHLRAGESAQATENFREVVSLSEAGSSEHEAGLLRLGDSMLLQARFAETIAIAKRVSASSRRAHAVKAEMLWGTALSLEGADLEGAAAHLHRAQAMCTLEGDPLLIADIEFELGSIAAQQGDLPRAIELYRQSLETARQAAQKPEIGENASIRLVLAHNNLAYHLHLLKDPAALEYAQAGLAIAREKGLLNLQPYLLSTMGEIHLASGDLDAAEHYFQEGLSLAEQLNSPERVAGLTANLGLAARARGQTDRAIHRFSTALAKAEATGTLHLAAQIRLWLAPLLPPDEARRLLEEVRVFAESSGRARLLEQLQQIEEG